ncbi:hypothetical protein BC834DRAFT_843931 [Gloeopeniophorella convolvens]|nr:hypothetical protein BC834DRAFT_843931 [Gloeopeniophorella convolvens]
MAAPANQPTSPSPPATDAPLAAAPPTLSAVLPQSVPMAHVDPEQPSMQVTAKEDPDELQIPNVYINGLPPNFPEEQLYAITKEFGGVISVRTFTRHVSDRPSGYGFVLFETIESAERCIEALRKYRNLHPSFCKSLHPIPGTRYASLSSSTSQSSQSSSSTEADTFKAKMERLKDESSTNLYVEGLPLSIDEPTMAALVAPYAIKSSRFFQTRLSHPPRTIAFVRLEDRSACEDVIKRLHGRMVRGWNDLGSRISVRFADSAEQRELRRSERTGRGDDSSPARLTMAQAALLNLRGQQMQGRVRTQQQTSSVLDQRRISSGQAHGTSYDYPDVHPQHGRLPPHPLVSAYQTEPKELILPSSRSASTRLHGRNSELQAGAILPPALGSEIDLSALPRSADSNGFTPLEQQLIVQARIQAEIDARQRILYGAQTGKAMTGGSTQGPSFLQNQGEELSRSLGDLSLRSALPVKEFVPRVSASRANQPQVFTPALSSRLQVDFLSSGASGEYHTKGSHSSQQQQQQQPGAVSAINSRILGLTSKDISKASGRSNLGGDRDRAVRPSNSLDFTSDNPESQPSASYALDNTTSPFHYQQLEYHPWFRSR